DGSMTFTGTLAAINAALNGLVYAPSANFNGPTSIQLTTEDLGNNGSGGNLSDTDTIAVNVVAANDAPVIAVPGAQNTDEDTSLVFSAGNGNLISIADLDAASGLLRVVLAVDHGTLTLGSLAGLTFVSGDGT